MKPLPSTPRGQTRPFVVGIAGGTGSGKSFLAQRLVRAFRGRCTVLSHDWYYRDCPPADAATRRERNFDRPAALETSLLRSHLRTLRAGRPAALPRYNYRTHRRLARAVPTAPAPLIVVEGLFVLADPALRRLCDLTIFVDTPVDVRLARRIARTIEERGLPVQEELRLYLRYARAGHARWVQPSRRHAQLVWEQHDTATSTTPIFKHIRQLLSRHV